MTDYHSWDESPKIDSRPEIEYKREYRGPLLDADGPPTPEPPKPPSLLTPPPPNPLPRMIAQDLPSSSSYTSTQVLTNTPSGGLPKVRPPTNPKRKPIAGPPRFGNVKGEMPDARPTKKTSKRQAKTTAEPCVTCGLLVVRDGKILSHPRVITPRLERALLVCVFVVAVAAILLAALIALRVSGYRLVLS